MSKVGVILAGCGHRDGSEVHEAVLTMLALEECGLNLECISVDKEQAKVIDHFTAKDQNSEKRNIFHESARIARGKIKKISEVTADDYQAIVLPGGMGAALNLCTFAEQGPNMTVDHDVERLLQATHSQKKPIGAVCIAPVILAKVFGKNNPRITIGTDIETADVIQKMGAKHINCNVDGVVIDVENLLITTPAFMLAKSPKDFWPGIKKLAQEVAKLIR